MPFIIRPEHKWILCFTGMEEASCKKAAFVSNYVDNTDDFNVVQGPAARIRPSRLPENYFSCKFLSVITQCLENVCVTQYCFFFSRLRRLGEEFVGMRTIPNVTLVFIRRMKNDLLPWLHIKQYLSLCAVSVLKCRTSDQPLRPYLKENLPKRLHFAYNNRIERGHLYMKNGWQAALYVNDLVLFLLC